MSIIPPRLSRFRRLVATDDWRRQRPRVSLADQRAEPVALVEPPVAHKKDRPPRAAISDDAHDYHKSEPEILDGDMKCADLTFALQHLCFGRNNLCTVKIDRDVARYLIHALRPHAARSVR